MARHALTGGGRPEPVAVSAAVQAVLAALVTLGWLNLDDTTLATLATVLGGALALGATLVARRRVTPADDPRAPDGTPLVPASSEAAEMLGPTPAAALLERETPPGGVE